MGLSALAYGIVSLAQIGLVGGILVTLGVAGELLFTYKASRVETKLRENSHAIETLLTKEAGDAAQSAKIAYDQADAVKGIAAEARADAKDARAKAQAAQRELAHAEADAAKAQAATSSTLKEVNFLDAQIAIAKNQIVEIRQVD